MRRLVSFILVALTAGTGVVRGEGAASRPLTVFAAASLQDALARIDPVWQAQGHAPVTVAYAASSALARQIEQGAPADVFFSADGDWMDYIEQRDLLRAGTRADVLGNALVLIAPADAAVTLRIAPDFALRAALGADGRLAIGEPDAVPAGKYARASLTSLHVWDAVSERLAPAENVRAALLLVARREAPLGIVYATDARADKTVRVVDTFPANTHPAIVYPIAVTQAATHADAAAFVVFVRSPEARRVFAQAGFTSPPDA